MVFKFFIKIRREEEEEREGGRRKGREKRREELRDRVKERILRLIIFCRKFYLFKFKMLNCNIYLLKGNNLLVFRSLKNDVVIICNNGVLEVKTI